MAQGEFTKEEAKATVETIEEIANDLSARQRYVKFAAHFNDIFAFLEAAEQAAPRKNE